MKLTASRLVAASVLAVCAMLLAGASGSKGPILQPNKLVIISTTDVKGKTGPCG
jgi:ABC-type branched-subunit amino acid transport system substrate-binding protein